MSEQGNYWTTSVSAITGDGVAVRGYLVDELIERATFTQTVFLAIKGELPSTAEERVLNAVLNGVVDYGLEKPGTVAARFVTSASASLANGIAAASLAMGEHTLSTKHAGQFARDALEEFIGSGQGRDEFAAAKVAELRARKKRIPGLGHPTFKRVDPRAQMLKSIAVDNGLWGEAALLYEAIHRAFTELPGKADVPINDVGALALVIDSLGFSPDEGEGLVFLSTIPGLIAHLSEERTAGVPIRVIPRDQVDYRAAAVRQLATERDSH